jgi:hypothetical protein
MFHKNSPLSHRKQYALQTKQLMIFNAVWESKRRFCENSMKCTNTLSEQNAVCLNVKSDGTYTRRSDFMRLCVEGVPVTPGQRE